MPKRKSAKGYSVKPWLSANLDSKERRYIQIGNSILLSKQFQALRPTAQILYFCMALESGLHRDFIFPQKTMTKYGLNRSTAVKGIEELIETGFIRKVYSGKATREPSKYEFINEWKMKPPLK